MKIIGKQIVVEWPEEKSTTHEFCDAYANHGPNRNYCQTEIDEDNKIIGRNAALSEVAQMNPSLEVDVKKMLKCFRDFNFEYFKTYRDSPPADVLINALASNPSAWMKRKDSDEHV